MTSAFLCMALIPAAPARPAADDDEEVEMKVRGALRDFEFGRESYRTLIELGPKAFPVYEAILAYPKSDPQTIARIFVVLADIDADRSRFVEPTVQRLADPEA